MAEDMLLIFTMVPFAAMRRLMKDWTIDIAPKRFVSNMLLTEGREASVAGIE